MSAAAAGRLVEVSGDFTAWVPISMPMGPDGCYAMDAVVPPGGRWGYHFRLDDGAWVTDPDADEFQLIEHGTISVRYS